MFTHRMTRLKSLIIKELLTLFRDPKSRLVLIMPPLMQLIIFAFAATLEVKNVSIAIYNQDIGRHGNEIVQRIHGSSTFRTLIFLKNEKGIKEVLDRQQVLVALSIPQDFSVAIESGSPADIQLILDGRRSNAAQISSGYLANLINQYNQEIALKQGKEVLPPVIAERNWFNENLLYLWFTVPSLVGILSMLVVLVVTSLSVARERELGTFDQILVSPLEPYEILIGKTIPAMIVGLAEGLFIWLVAIKIFKIPYNGSFWLLLMALIIFILSVVGVGLFISSLSQTQQQAILGTFVFMVPSVTLSGYAAPVENMPVWLQIADEANPLKHFLIIIKGLFLKGMPLAEVWSHTWPVLIIGAVTLPVAGLYFNIRKS